MGAGAVGPSADAGSRGAGMGTPLGDPAGHGGAEGLRSLAAGAPTGGGGQRGQPFASSGGRVSAAETTMGLLSAIGSRVRLQAWDALRVR